MHGVRPWELPALIAIAVAVLVLDGCSREPKSYEDCVLKALGGPGRIRDLAARMVDEACAAKYLSRPEDIELESAQMAWLVKGEGYPDGTFFKGFVYNGNADIMITSLDVKVIHDTEDDIPRVYRAAVGIYPLTTEDFLFELIDTYGDFPWERVFRGWEIVSARGRRIEEGSDPAASKGHHAGLARARTGGAGS